MRAARSNDFASAKAHAENIVRRGVRVVEDPEFIQCFQEHYPGLEPKEVFEHLCRFLVCATDGRAKVLKQWVQDNKPEIA